MLLTDPSAAAAFGFILALLCLLPIVILACRKKPGVTANSHLKIVDQVAHEIKSPLAAIIGYTSLLNARQLGPLGEQQAEPLQIIDHQSRRILEIVQDCLDLTRLEARQLKFETKPGSLAAAAARALDETAAQLNAKRVTVDREFDPRTPTVAMNEEKIVRVFANLISNAVKYSREGGRIAITLAPHRNGALAAVRDEGLGIAPADLPHVFEPFFNPNKESAAQRETGMGLALCKLIVEKGHGGRLWGTSEGPGRGATFSFALPRAA